MKCVKCGQEIADGAKFCYHCGAMQQAAEAPVQTPAAAPAPVASEPVSQAAPAPEVQPVQQPQWQQPVQPQAFVPQQGQAYGGWQQPQQSQWQQPAQQPQQPYGYQQPYQGFPQGMYPMQSPVYLKPLLTPAQYLAKAYKNAFWSLLTLALVLIAPLIKVFRGYSFSWEEAEKWIDEIAEGWSVAGTYDSMIYHIAHKYYNFTAWDSAFWISLIAAWIAGVIAIIAVYKLLNGRSDEQRLKGFSSLSFASLIVASVGVLAILVYIIYERTKTQEDRIFNLLGYLFYIILPILAYLPAILLKVNIKNYKRALAQENK